jgi:Putative peptidase family
MSKYQHSQRCIIVVGRFDQIDGEDYVTVISRDASGNTTFPDQSWPVTSGRTKIITMFTPGWNRLIITRGQNNRPSEININYVPLVQNPPLHLAIMIARDSPLLIDCPSEEYGGIPSEHASLDAAIAKFRMTAYLWTALTAEDMRQKGLGRRSFRLDEEWISDTTSFSFIGNQNDSRSSPSGSMRYSAKVHIVRTNKTTAEIRHMDNAQQNPNANNKAIIFDWFKDALNMYGSPFHESNRPIVAGLVLDAHFDIRYQTIVGHAALGLCNRIGLSLGMCGSHLTYSWPRFLEEIVSCFLDTRNPGPTVGNDCHECGTFWEACAIGQGAFLHEVGHAFGAPHSSGIMVRGYSGFWPRNFLTKTAYWSHRNQKGVDVIEGETENEARWDLSDTLNWKNLPHFRLPSDVPLPWDLLAKLPSIKHSGDKNNGTVNIMSESGIASINLNGTTEITLHDPFVYTKSYTTEDLKNRFGFSNQLNLTVLGMNGKSKVVNDVWSLFDNQNYIHIPGSNTVLGKYSVMAKDLEDGKCDTSRLAKWSTLLTHKHRDNSIRGPTKVVIHTGLYLDGAYIHFGKFAQHVIKCSPQRMRDGREHIIGGGPFKLKVSRNARVIKLEISRRECALAGLRIHFSDGTFVGRLTDAGDYPETMVLGKYILMIYRTIFVELY